MKYRAERQFIKLVGATVRTYDASGALVCKAEAKAFKLKEDVQFFHDEAKTQPYFSIKARNIIDISATYDITDSTGTIIGALQRKGLSSAFVRDQWLILDASGQQLGEILEDSSALGFLRRYIDLVSLLLPQQFQITMGSEHVGTMVQNKNPFTVKLDCDYDDTKVQYLGSLLPVAIPSMLAIIDARQN